MYGFAAGKPPYSAHLNITPILAQNPPLPLLHLPPFLPNVIFDIDDSDKRSNPVDDIFDNCGDRRRQRRHKPTAAFAEFAAFSAYSANYSLKTAIKAIALDSEIAISESSCA